MDLQLDGLVIIVTGGTDGLGLALSERLLEQGARVAVCSRSADAIRRLQHRWDSESREALCRQADVTDARAMVGFVGSVIERWERLDGLVNNAGRSSSHPFEAVPDDEWYDDFDLKVHAAVRLIRLCLPHLRRSESASILNVLNTGARTPGARSLPTTASRAAGLAITKALSRELGADAIRVNAVLVGLVASGQWRRRAEREQRSIDELYESMARSIPLGRVGDAEEFADIATFLLSRRASYVTGSAINVDGGLSYAL